MPRRVLSVGLGVAMFAIACSHAPPEPERRDAGPSGATTPAALVVTPPPADAGSLDAALDATPLEDTMAGHYDRLEDLIGFVLVKDPSRLRKKGRSPDEFLNMTFGLGSPSHLNQGNKAIAHHAIGRAQCLAGLAGTELQTEEQKHICGGADLMVPIYKKGKLKGAHTCIDVFEFPNKPCEIPIVWASPIQAQMVCQLEGKRLCTQEEWTLACRGDPEGGADRTYAYGDEMDLAICNTNKAAGSFKDTVCDPASAATAWKSCGTNTEPTGAFPQCKSRFGVYDQHGNVAEIMTRLDEDGTTYSQLKGSAFFYVDVARKQHEVPPKDRETYPDMCGYDPRWHVEPMESAWHVNYHLGFRCCKSIH